MSQRLVKGIIAVTKQMARIVNERARQPRARGGTSMAVLSQSATCLLWLRGPSPISPKESALQAHKVLSPLLSLLFAHARYTRRNGPSERVISRTVKGHAGATQSCRSCSHKAPGTSRSLYLPIRHEHAERGGLINSTALIHKLPRQELMRTLSHD